MFLKKFSKKKVFFMGIIVLAFAFVTMVTLLSNKYGDELHAFQHNVSILYNEQTQEDELPEGHSVESVDPATTRLIAERSDKSYWVASNEQSQICIIAMLGVGSDDWVLGVSCDSEVRFQRHGVGVTVKSIVDNETNLYTSAVFMPDGYNNNAASILSEAYVTNNLIVFDSSDLVEAATNTRRSVVIPADSTTDGLDEIELIFP